MGTEITLFHKSQLSECSGLSQRCYKVWRHDKIAQVTHWKMCQRFSLGASEKLYNCQIKKVLETNGVKILWDFQTNWQLLLSKKKKSTEIAVEH